MPLASILHAFSRARSASRARTAKYSSLAWMNLEQESADTVLVGLAESLLVSALKFTGRKFSELVERVLRQSMFSAELMPALALNSLLTELSSSWLS